MLLQFVKVNVTMIESCLWVVVAERQIQSSCRKEAQTNFLEQEHGAYEDRYPGGKRGTVNFQIFSS